MHSVFRKLVSVAGILIGTCAQANQIWVADFSSSTLDPALIPIVRPNWTLTSGGGVLDFATLGGDATTNSSSVRYSVFLDGDFTATVTIDLSHTSQNVVAQLAFQGPTGSTLATNISLFKSGPSALASIGGFDPTTGTFPPNVFGVSSVVTFRIDRTDDFFTESYKIGSASAFTVFDTFDGSVWHDVGGTVRLVARHNSASPTAADVRFSNFSVATVPEANSFALLLAALGTLGFTFRATGKRRFGAV